MYTATSRANTMAPRFWPGAMLAVRVKTIMEYPLFENEKTQ
jgi:hypothetical protein